MGFAKENSISQWWAPPSLRLQLHDAERKARDRSTGIVKRDAAVTVVVEGVVRVAEIDVLDAGFQPTGLTLLPEIAAFWEVYRPSRDGSDIRDLRQDCGWKPR